MKVASSICLIRVRCGIRVTGCRNEIRDTSRGMRAVNLGSRISHHEPRIAYPASRITYLVLCIIGRAVNGRGGSIYGRTTI